MEGRSSYECDLDNLRATELRLGLPGSGAPEKPASMASRGTKRTLAETEECQTKGITSSEGGSVGSNQEAAPLAKVQVVGWPPVRAHRRFLAKKEEAETAGIYVKVSMDGAPYLRKIDLKVYKGYKELREALEDLFMCFSLGELSGMEGYSECEYAITYEDKDGDWMLVGDVPFEMFILSCKRLRIMKGSEARGLGSSL